MKSDGGVFYTYQIITIDSSTNHQDIYHEFRHIKYHAEEGEVYIGGVFNGCKLILYEFGQSESKYMTHWIMVVDLYDIILNQTYPVNFIAKYRCHPIIYIRDDCLYYFGASTYQMNLTTRSIKIDHKPKFDPRIIYQLITLPWTSRTDLYTWNHIDNQFVLSKYINSNSTAKPPIISQSHHPPFTVINYLDFTRKKCREILRSTVTTMIPVLTEIIVSYLPDYLSISPLHFTQYIQFPAFHMFTLYHNR